MNGPPICRLRREFGEARPRRGEDGFTLVELLISLALVVLILLAVLGIIDTYNKLARAQMQVTDMQQSVRVAQHEMVRMARMAARGGLPRGTLPGGFGIAIANNVASGTKIDALPPAAPAAPTPTTPQIEAGTDVLIVRSALEGSLYQLGEGSASLTGIPPTGGTVTITNPGPWGVPQETLPLKKVVDDGLDETLILVSPVGDFAVVRLDADSALTDVSDLSTLVLAFTIDSEGLAISRASACFDPTQLPPCFPAAMRFGGAVGILEEYRYYVRADTTGGEPTPHLTRARFVPGTNTAHSAGSLKEDIADFILDLQLALAVDVTDPAGTGVPDGQIFEDGTANDDWLFNAAGETAAPFNPPGPTPRLFYLRINTLARTGRRDLNFVSEPIQTIEDRAYGELEAPATEAQRLQRMFRRRLLQTIVDLRNLS